MDLTYSESGSAAAVDEVEIQCMPHFAKFQIKAKLPEQLRAEYKASGKHKYKVPKPDEDRIMKIIISLANSGGGELVFTEQDNQKIFSNFFKDSLETRFEECGFQEKPYINRQRNKPTVIVVPRETCLVSRCSAYECTSEKTQLLSVEKMKKYFEQSSHRKNKNADEIKRKLRSRYLPKDIEYESSLKNLGETNQLQFKQLKEDASDPVSDRMFGNKLTHYVSGFAMGAGAGVSGGMIIFGVDDRGVIKGVTVNKTTEMGGETFEEIKERVSRRLEDMKLLSFDGVLVKPVEKTHFLLEELPVLNRDLGGNKKSVCIVIYVCKFRGICLTKEPESYFINPEKQTIESYSAASWFFRTFKDNAKDLQLKIEPATLEKDTTLFELLSLNEGQQTNIKQIVKELKDTVFKMNKSFPVHPEHLLTHCLSEHVANVVKRIKKKYTSKYSTEGIIFLLEDTCDVANYELLHVVIVSQFAGLHIEIIVKDELETTDMNHPSIVCGIKMKALRLVKKIYDQGGFRGPIPGCTLKLRNQEGMEIADDFSLTDEEIQIPNDSSLECDTLDEEGITDEEDENFIEKLMNALAIVFCSFENTMLTEKLGIAIFSVLTKEQWTILHRDRFRDTKCFIHGTAGTGKTILAIEVIKKLKLNGARNDEILYVAENVGLVSFIRSLNLCLSDTRAAFVNTENKWVGIKHIIMDEAHHYRLKEGEWYQKATKIVNKAAEGECRSGYLWIFIDMFQKENNFPSGIPHIRNQSPIEKLTTVVRNKPGIWKMTKMYADTDNFASPELEIFYRELLNETEYYGVNGIKKWGDRPIIKEVNCEENINLLVENYVKDAIAEGRRSETAFLFKDMDEVQKFKSSFYKNNNIELKLADDTEAGDHVVVDSVRRFSGRERPYVYIVQPDVDRKYFTFKRFMYVAASRAMWHLIIIANGPVYTELSTITHGLFTIKRKLRSGDTSDSPPKKTAILRTHNF